MLSALLWSVAVLGKLDADRFHLIDMYPRDAPRNFLIRGSNPMQPDATTGKLAFDLSGVMAAFELAATTRCGVALPATYRIVDLDLENPSDPGYWDEFAWWKQQPPSVGHAMAWMLLGSARGVQGTSAKKQQELVASGAWSMGGHADHLPERLAAARAMLQNVTGPPTVYYLHCNAGCDRTGEFMGSYMMTYLKYNVTTAMGEDCRQCGRCPNYYATNSLGWWCLTLQQLHNRTDVGDCERFSKCKLFGDCEAVDPTLAANACPTDVTPPMQGWTQTREA